MSKRSFSALLNTAAGLKTFHTVVKAIKYKHAFFPLLHSFEHGCNSKRELLVFSCVNFLFADALVDAHPLPPCFSVCSFKSSQPTPRKAACSGLPLYIFLSLLTILNQCHPHYTAPLTLTHQPLKPNRGAVSKSYLGRSVPLSVRAARC